MTLNGPAKAVLGALATGAAILSLVYFGVRLGDTERRITTTEQRLAEEIPRATVEHHAIEERTDQKLAQQRDLILAELRAINQRLDRIERRLP